MDEKLTTFVFIDVNCQIWRLALTKLSLSTVNVKFIDGLNTYLLLWRSDPKWLLASDTRERHNKNTAVYSARSWSTRTIHFKLQWPFVRPTLATACSLYSYNTKSITTLKLHMRVHTHNSFDCLRMPWLSALTRLSATTAASITDCVKIMSLICACR